jgi:hypothetical protein
MAGWLKECVDADQRAQSFPQLTKAGRQRLRKTDLVPGDIVAYKNDHNSLTRWVVQELHGPPGSPATATIRKVTHDADVTDTVLVSDLAGKQSLKVDYTTLTNCGTPAPMVPLFCDLDPQVGEFVFFLQENDVYPGMILAVDGNKLVVQNYKVSPTGTTTKPMWMTASGDIYSKRDKRNTSDTPFSENILVSDIEALTKLDNYKIPNEVYSKLAATGKKLNLT